jgi:FHS family glucose/mannose:H+ symporter-like MFS transporter
VETDVTASATFVEKRPQTTAYSMPLLHAGFVLTGMANTMLGPLLPLLSGRWNLSDAQAGYLFAAQFGASMIGVTLSSLLVPRWGSRRTLMLGLLIMGAGAGTLGLGTWILGIFAAALVGTGFGLTIPTTNLLVSDLNPERRASALNLVNFSWGVGAVVCPFLIAVLDRAGRASVFTLGMLAALVVLTAIVSFSALDARGQKTERAAVDPNAWRSPLVPVLAGIFFLYVGSEASVGGWIALYARRTLSSSGGAWILTPSFFWAMLLVGRAVAPLILRRVPELLLARIGVVLAGAGIVGFLAARNMAFLGASVALSGLGFSAVYPIAIAVLSEKFGTMAPRIGGLLFSLAGLGGTVMPWIVGYTSTRFSSLGLALTVPLLGCAAMFALYSVLSAWERKAARTLPV